MQTVPYYEVLQHTCALCGLTDPAIEAPDTAKRAALDRFAARRLKQCFEIAWWPETMRSELRYYRQFYDASVSAYAGPSSTATTLTANEVWFEPARKYYQTVKLTGATDPATLTAGQFVTNKDQWAECAGSYSGADWAAGTAYAVGDIVRRVDSPDTIPLSGRFYHCHTAHTAGSSFDTTKFGRLTPFSPSIAYDQVQTTSAGVGAVALTPIGRVRGVFVEDALDGLDPARVPYALGPDAIELLGESVPSSAWLLFQVRCPQLKGTTYSASATYAVGQFIYYASSTAGFEGDFYKCITATTAGQAPEGTASKWTKQDFPAWLRDPVAHYAAADYLRSTGARDQALLEEQAAEALLAREILNQRSTQDHLVRYRAA